MGQDGSHLADAASRTVKNFLGVSHTARYTDAIFDVLRSSTHTLELPPHL